MFQINAPFGGRLFEGAFKRRGRLIEVIRYSLLRFDFGLIRKPRDMGFHFDVRMRPSHPRQGALPPTTPGPLLAAPRPK